MSNKEYKELIKVFRVWDGKSMSYDFELGERWIGNNGGEFMQWIGKVDINQKKIFESDILKFKDPSYWEHIAYGQVVYNTRNCQFEVRNLKRSTYSDKSFSYPEHEFCRMHEIEVIGNIYENPNMLIEYDEIPKEKVKKK